MNEPIKIGNKYKRQSDKSHPYIANGDIITVVSDRRDKVSNKYGAFVIGIVAENGWSTETSEEMIERHYVPVEVPQEVTERDADTGFAITLKPPTPEEVTKLMETYERKLELAKADAIRAQEAAQAAKAEAERYREGYEKDRLQAVQETFGEVQERHIWKVRGTYYSRNWLGKTYPNDIQVEVITERREITEAAIAAEARLRSEYDNVQIDSIRYERDIAAVKHVIDSATLFGY